MNDHNTLVSKRFYANRRLALLRFLNEEPDGSLNVSLLKDAMDDIGAPIRLPEVMTESEWLQERGLVRLEHVRHIVKVTITGLGRDVVAGDVRIEGVKAPHQR